VTATTLVGSLRPRADSGTVGSSQKATRTARRGLPDIHDRNAGRTALLRPSILQSRLSYREERGENISWVLSRLPDCVKEVIVVDGRSEDSTAAIVRSVCPAAKVIEHGNSGKGNAIATGLLAAQGDVVVMLDADGSMDPSRSCYTLRLSAPGPTL